jgi:cytosine/adenosine deaminase-related metal-dependent hydrolase
MIQKSRYLLVAILCVCLWASSWAATTVTAGTDPTKFVLQGKVVTPDEIIDGKVVVEGDTITCVGTCQNPDGAWLLRVTSAFILPGFIDAHNHVAYNVFGKWTPPKIYENRGQWQRAPAYQAFKAPYNNLKDKAICEMVKYGELKALISGITTIQGTAPSRTCYRTLIRNAENQNELGLPSNHIRTFILDISSFRSAIDWNETKSFVVHLAEGIDARSRDEFKTLKQKGLLAAGTAIIHGTAFGEAEFMEMAAAGAKLIWSPRSNLVLYDKTTDIRLAYRHGVPVSLGVDWNPTGSDNLFDELRVAAQVNEDELDNVIPDSDWIKLITVNPASALALDSLIGRLAPNMKADIVIVRERHADPGQSLLLSRLQDVQMVWVGGKLLYGNRVAVERIRPGQCESLTVYGSSKRICVKDATNPNSNQSLNDLRAKLLQLHPALAPLTP